MKKREFLIEIREPANGALLAGGIFVASNFADAFYEAHLAAGAAIGRSVSDFLAGPQTGQFVLFKDPNLPREAIR